MTGTERPWLEEKRHAHTWNPSFARGQDRFGRKGEKRKMIARGTEKRQGEAKKREKETKPKTPPKKKKKNTKQKTPHRPNTHQKPPPTPPKPKPKKGALEEGEVRGKRDLFY